MKLTIFGTPVALQSFKYTKTGIKYQPKHIKESKHSMIVQLVNQLPKKYVPFTGPVVISELAFVFPLLKSFSKKKLAQIGKGIKIYKKTRPDLDNLCKNLFDVMNGIVWMDDSQIVELSNVTKLYGPVPGIYICIAEDTSKWLT